MSKIKKVKKNASDELVKSALAKGDLISQDGKIIKTSKAVPTSNKPFLQIEEPRDGGDLIFYNPNPAYAYRYTHKEKMASGRYKHWVRLDKKHPDLKDMEYARDDTPDQSFVTAGDLILSCCRIETYQKMMAKRKAKTDARTSQPTKSFKGEINKLKKGMGSKHKGLALIGEHTTERHSASEDSEE